MKPNKALDILTRMHLAISIDKGGCDCAGCKENREALSYAMQAIIERGERIKTVTYETK